MAGGALLRCYSSDAYFAQLPDGHVFPMDKFPVSAAAVAGRGIGRVIDPGFLAEAELLGVHTGGYVDSIRTGQYNALTDLRLGLPWHPTIWTRSRAATAGTLAATYAAFDDGLAANLAGGTHHAFADRGEGYCVFNDVAIAIRHLQQREPYLQAMVIDLDAHQGNGTHHIFREDANVYTYSMHVGRNYPSRKEPGTQDVELPRWCDGDTYLRRLAETLAPAVDQHEPDVAFLILGVDVHADDRFGQMKLSTRQMRQRDALAIQTCRDRAVPVVLLYGGGYNRTPGMTAELHVQSVTVAAGQLAAERAAP